MKRFVWLVMIVTFIGLAIMNSCKEEKYNEWMISFVNHTSDSIWIHETNSAYLIRPFETSNRLQNQKGDMPIVLGSEYVVYSISNWRTTYKFTGKITYTNNIY